MNMKKKTPQSIWQRLKSEISDAQLRDIATADYDYSTEKHYQALRDILNHGKLPVKLEWEPREVLSLCRWRKYEGNTEASLTVFFCSVCLVAAAESPQSSEMLDGQIDNLIVAIDTAQQLGGDWLEEFYRLLIELLPHISVEVHDEDYLYFHLATYLSARILGLHEQECGALLGEVIAAERLIQTHWAHQQGLPNADILSYSCFDSRHELWSGYLKQFGTELESRRLEEFGPFSF